MSSPQEGEAQVRRSIEVNGPADPQVVQLENELNVALQSGGADHQIVPLKQQLLRRYEQAVVARGARLQSEELGKDVFFEVYNQRIVALCQELGQEARPPLVLAHLFLAGIYRDREQADLSRQHLAQFRRLTELQPSLVSDMGDAVVRELTTMVQALLRPDLPYPNHQALLQS
ncbi:hypothetical protein ACTL6U_11495 [Rhodovibrionaceae bacterium A322]